jgi:hypothetical protein
MLNIKNASNTEIEKKEDGHNLTTYPNREQSLSHSTRYRLTFARHMATIFLSYCLAAL